MGARNVAPGRGHVKGSRGRSVPFVVPHPAFPDVRIVDPHGAARDGKSVDPSDLVTAPLRVTLVLPSLMVGGAEQHVVKLCRSVDPARAALTLVVLRRDLPQELRRFLPDHVAVHVAPVGRRDPRMLPWLVGTLSATRADVAQSFLWYADMITATAALTMPRLGFVASERGERTTPDETLMRRMLDRLVIFARAHSVCANSAFGAAAVVALGAPARRVAVIPNAVDLTAVDQLSPAAIRAELSWPPDAHLVATACRLVKEKGVDALVSAIASGPPALRAVVIGDGPERPALETLAARLGVTDRVAFLGQRIPSLPYLAACDSAVMLSPASEHCSNGILEAMGCGKPVVATAVGGNPELVRDGVTGLLVPPGDARALVAALGTLAGDRSLAQRLGAAGRERVEREFRMESVAARFVELWTAAADAR